MSFEIYAPEALNAIAEKCAEDFGAFAYDGFGIMLDDQQLEAHAKIGTAGPVGRGEAKYNWLSGGQRSGKTVFGFLMHADGCVYKRGLDTIDSAYWDNYIYATLAIAPSNELALRLWTIGLEVSKGANDAQYDRNARRSRGGAFLDQFIAGKEGPWGIWRWQNQSVTNFRSSEGMADRLEGGQWWWITWDEWASQPAREIRVVLTEKLMGRSRDHNAKIMPMAWPKAETEYKLIEVIRRIERGKSHDEKVVFLDASKAYFSNQAALKIEHRNKTDAEWKRTVQGVPAGGGSLVFKKAAVDNAVNEDLRFPVLPEHGYRYLSSWDLALSHDQIVGFTFRIPIISSRPIVTPQHRARIVNATVLNPDEATDLDALAFAIAKEQAAYRSQSAIDATAMGGIAAFRQLRHLSPAPWPFVSKGQDRIYGNMRLAAITNGKDCFSWGHTEENKEGPWGLLEMPPIEELTDQLASFDDQAKDIPDDWVWALLIGLWFIRLYWAVGEPGNYENTVFDLRSNAPVIPEEAKPERRRTLVEPPTGDAEGIAWIYPKDPYTGRRERVTVPPARRA